MNRTLGLALLLSIALGVAPEVRAADPVVHLVTSGRDDLDNAFPDSLRGALQDVAGPGEEIRFAPGLVIDLAETLSIDSSVFIRGPVTIRGKRGEAVVVAADGVIVTDVTFLDVDVRTATLSRQGKRTGIDGPFVVDCTFEGRSGLLLDRTTGAAFQRCTVKPASDSPRIPVRLKATKRTFLAHFNVEGGPATSLLDAESEELHVGSSDFAGDVRLATASGEFLSNFVRGARGVAVVPSPGPGVDPPAPGAPRLRFEENHALTMSVRGTGVALSLNVLGEGALGAKPPAGNKKAARSVLTITPSGGALPLADVTLTENTVTGGDIGIRLVSGPTGTFAKTTLVKNTVKGASQVGIRVSRAGDVVFEDNKIEACGSSAAGIGLFIDGTSSEGAEFNGDEVLDTRGTGIAVRASHQIKLGETVTRSSTDGVAVAKGRGVVLLFGSDIESNGGHGLHAERGARATLLYCTLKDNTGAGVFVESGATVLVSDGGFERNGGLGIDLSPRGISSNEEGVQANRGIGFPEGLEIDPETRVLRGLADPGATVQVWIVGKDSDDVNGEGTRLLGFTTCDETGAFQFPEAGELDCDEEDRLTTTASLTANGVGVTSEFSPNIACPDRPDWFAVESGTTANLVAVWVLADDDAWAVGAQGTVLRWNGHSWDRYDAGTTEDLTDVVAFGPDEVYVTAFDDLLKYDGSAWSVVHSLPTGTLWGNAMWGSPEAGIFAGWAVGAIGLPSSRQRFHRYPAGVDTWVHPYFGEGQVGADIRGSPGSPFEGVWGLSATDVWCVSLGGTVYHYDGNSEAKAEPGLPDHVGKFQLVHQLPKPSNRDLWAGGGHVFTAGQAPFRFDGSSWTQQTFAITPQGSYSVWGNAPDDVWATADGPFQFAPGRNEAAIFHFDGTQWTQDSMPQRTPPLHRVRGVIGGLRVAVGEGGAILHHK